MKHLQLETLFVFCISVSSLTVAFRNSILDYNNINWTNSVQDGESASNTSQTEIFTSMSHSLQHLDECSPWMFYNQEQNKCECGDVPYRAVNCDPEISSRTFILHCFCMTHDYGTNQTYLGRCLYGCGQKIDTVYYKLPNSTDDLNNYSCGEYNRDSILCGECLPGFSPLLYSYDMKCVNCTGQSMTYNWIKYIAVAYVPLTVFFISVVAFNFDGTHPLFKVYITISQGLSSPIFVRSILIGYVGKSFVGYFVRGIGCFYGIWNLDFFRMVLPPICMTNITNLQVLALDYAIAFYPLILILISYIFIRMYSRDVRIIVWLWKPFHKVFRLFKKNWDLEGSIVKSFATFFLLSYLKIINVTFDLLTVTDMYVMNNNSKNYSRKISLYYDSSVEYLGSEHLPFAILALLIGFFVGVFPLVFLVVYPLRCFQKFLNCLNIQRQVIDTFVNCYQGYYKDGTSGTRDYRWFSIMYFALQLSIFALFMIARSIITYILGALACMLLMFVQLSLQPYKQKFKYYNITDSLLLFITGGIFVMVVVSDEANIKAVFFSEFSTICVAIFILLPFVYFFAAFAWLLLVKKNLKTWCTCNNVFQFRSMRVLRQDVHEESNDFVDRIQNLTYCSNPDEPFTAV